MERLIREQHEKKINYLIAKRRQIEDVSGARIDPDLRLAYSWISDEIKHLKQGLYEQDYRQYEQKLSDALGIGRSGK